MWQLSLLETSLGLDSAWTYVQVLVLLLTPE